jgi:hypothetical protein
MFFLLNGFSALILCQFGDLTILVGSACLLSVIVIDMHRRLLPHASLIGASLVGYRCFRVLEGRTLLFLDHTD